MFKLNANNLFRYSNIKKKNNIVFSEIIMYVLYAVRRWNKKNQSRRLKMINLRWWLCFVLSLVIKQINPEMLLLYLIVLYVYLLWQIFDVQRGRRRRTIEYAKPEGIATKIDFLFFVKFPLWIEDLWPIAFYVFKYKY